MDEPNLKDSFFIYPDPVTNPGMLTGAVFLYFDNPLIFTLPPQVITKDAFELLKLVDERKPIWSEALYGLLSMWRNQQEGFHNCLDVLSPLKNDKFKVIWTSYNANLLALEQAKEFIESSGYTLEEAGKIIDPFNAAGEAVRHLFLEAYLENDKDIDKLFDYCDSIFQSNDFPKFLTKCYFLRTPFLSALGQGDISLLLTNQKLLPLLDSLPIEPSRIPEDWRSVQDVVSWEIFRRIISPRLDPMTPEKVSILVEIIKKRHKAIESMKNRCGLLAYDVEISAKKHNLQRDIEKIIRSVAPEISSLFEIDKKATQEFINSLFADEKTWMFFAAVVSGLVTGRLALTAGAAVASFSNIGAKAFKAAAERKINIKTNDFALLYFLHDQ
jgi:hypothetical protein